MINERKVLIGDVAISNSSFASIVEVISDRIEKNAKCVITYVNHHIFNLCKQNTPLRKIINASTISHSDGIGVWLGAKIIGRNIRRFNWTDHALKFLEICEKENWTIYFYGSTKNVIAEALANLRKSKPNLKLKGGIDDFSGIDENEIINIINTQNVDILWVGLGSPKQELWIERNSQKLNVKVIHAVGDIFSFVAGKKIRGPKLFQLLGFEWLFRLITEPRRFWKRYLLGIPKFIITIVKLYFTHVTNASKK